MKECLNGKTLSPDNLDIEKISETIIKENNKAFFDESLSKEIKDIPFFVKQG